MTGMQPAEMASSTRRLVAVSPRGQKQNLSEQKMWLPAATAREREVVPTGSLLRPGLDFGDKRLCKVDNTLLTFSL